MKIDKKTLEALRVSTETLILAGKEGGYSDLFAAQLEKVESILAILKAADASAARVQSVQIPIPPSVNDLTATVWRGKGRASRVKTAAQREFLTKAEHAIRLGMKPVTAYPVHVSVTVIGGKGFPASRDVSNAIKAAEDALVQAGIIENDSREFVRKSGAEFIQATGPAICFLEVAEPGVAK